MPDEFQMVLPPIPIVSQIIYLENLTPRIFKLLPLAEDEGRETTKIYLWALINDLISANAMFNNILIELVTKINCLRNDELAYKDFRKTVFDSISLSKKIKENLQKEVLMDG
jgi:hypothetical protein